MNKVVTTERIPIKLWLDNIEDGALIQAKNLANLAFAFKHIAIMPDSHQGYGMPIGGVLASERVIVPNAVGVDIGCGMRATKTTLREISTGEMKGILARIRSALPLGFEHHEEPQPWDGFDKAPDIEIIQRELERARYQIGTLGGGNHFIEIQQGDDGHIWLMLHSGSRNFGLQVAKEYHKKAVALCERWHSSLPDKELAFLPIDSTEGQQYFKAMNYCLEFAFANRMLMMERIQDIVREQTGAAIMRSLDIHHNYAAIENHFGRNVLIHRKGAVKAAPGHAGIIPGSMGAASFIVEGLGNPESFMSSSHGAGRRMGRREAQRILDLAEEQRKMEGILGGPRGRNDLDEAPGAYKDIDEVMENQADLTKIIVKLHPLASLKAG